MKTSFRSISALLISALMIATTALAAPLPSSVVYIVTDPATPASKALTPGQLNVDVFYFDLYSRPTEGAKMTKISFQYKGVNNGDELTLVKLFDLNANQYLGTVTPVPGSISFTGLSVTLPKNQKRRFALRVDVNDAAFAKAGENFAFSVDSVSAYGLNSAESLAFKKVNNWSSNFFTFVSTSHLVLSTSASQPAMNVMFGFDQPVFYFNVTNNGLNAVSLKKITYDYNFSGQPAVNVFRIRDFVTKQVLGTFTPVMGTNSANLSTPFVLAPNATTQFEFDADLMPVTGFGNTFQITVKDLEGIDAVSGEKVPVTGAAQGPVKIVGN